MPVQEPTLQEWERLYEVARLIKQLAPWEHMLEDDLFGVQHPDTGELGFVSVMGTLGEHLAIAVYQGVDAVFDFLAIANSDEALPPEMVLMIPQLQLSFEDRAEIDKVDHAVIKQLGLRFRGRQAWPQFRSFRPGYLPWYLEADEVRALTIILEQLVDVAQRENLEDVLIPDDQPDAWFVRVPKRENGSLTWHDTYMILEPSPEDERMIEPLSDEFALAYLKKLPQQPVSVEVDAFINWNIQIGEEGERPFFPYMLLLAESESGMILGFEILSAHNDLAQMWATLPAHLTGILAKANLRPRAIKMSNPLIYRLLEPLADELGCNLRETLDTPAVAEAREAVMMYFANQ